MQADWLGWGAMHQYCRALGRRTVYGVFISPRHFSCSAQLLLASAVAPAKPGSVDGRTAHWVIRCTDLQPFLEFASKCFGMKVIRHEENSQPCDITCNVSAQRSPSAAPAR